MKNVLLVGGYYATNIGNAFYEMGIKHVLESIEGICVHKASDIQDFGWDMYNSKSSSSFNPCCSFKNIDYLILTGPAISEYTLRRWTPLFNHCNQTNTKVMFVSAGGDVYDSDELSITRSILSGIHPYALISRDHYTYEHYNDVFDLAFDGICFASFIPEFFRPYAFDTEPYVVVNFETYVDPRFVKANDSDLDTFFFDGEKWKILGNMRRRHGFTQRRPESTVFDRFLAVHTKNTCIPGKKYQKYEGNNIFLSDIPEDYLNIIYNASAVISDRVHTCVASLMLGKPTMFLGRTKRANLFRSIIGNQYSVFDKQFVQIDPSALQVKRDELRDALREALI